MAIKEKEKRGPPKSTQLEKARRYLTKGSLLHVDSDDELGADDHPWEWIYDEISVAPPDGADDPDAPTPSRKRKASAMLESTTKKIIVGARMGSFECRIGDTVLLKSGESGKDWVGIICLFAEDEDEEQEDQKVANIMWFVSPDEFRGKKNKRRADALPNEQYITPDFNMNPLTTINGKARVMSKDAFFARYKHGAAPKGRKALAEYQKCVVCRRGVNQRTAVYTEEFIWEDIYKGTPEDILALDDRVRPLKGRRKKGENREEDETDVITPPTLCEKIADIESSTSTPKSKPIQFQAHHAKSRKQPPPPELRNPTAYPATQPQPTNASPSKSRWNSPL